MKHSEINTASVDRIYAVSSVLFTDAETLTEWIRNCGLSMDSKVDFVGPTALHNAKATALRIGQSFDKEGTILFLNIDCDEGIRSFIQDIKDYQRNRMNYIILEPTENKEVFLNVDTQKLTTLYHSENTEMENNELTQVEKSEEHNDFGSMGWEPDFGTFGWDHAKSLLSKGIPVRRLKHGANSFVGFNEGKTIPADGFWVEANKEAAIRNGGFLTVKPYYTFCDGLSVDMAYRPTMEDEMATDWVEATKNVIVTEMEALSNGDYLVRYELMNVPKDVGGAKLKAIYPIIANTDVSNVALLSGNHDTAIMLMSIVTDMKHKLFGEEPIATTKILKGREAPYDSRSVDFLSVEPGLVIEKHDWDRDAILAELSIIIKNNPSISIIIDVKGLVKDHSFEDGDPQENEERAIDFINEMINAFKNNPDFKDTKWAAIDLELESYQG